MGGGGHWPHHAVGVPQPGQKHVTGCERNAKAHCTGLAWSASPGRPGCLTPAWPWCSLHTVSKQSVSAFFRFIFLACRWIPRIHPSHRCPLRQVPTPAYVKPWPANAFAYAGWAYASDNSVGGVGAARAYSGGHPGDAACLTWRIASQHPRIRSTQFAHVQLHRVRHRLRSPARRPVS